MMNQPKRKVVKRGYHPWILTMDAESFRDIRKGVKTMGRAKNLGDELKGERRMNPMTPRLLQPLESLEETHRATSVTGR